MDVAQYRSRVRDLVVDVGEQQSINRRGGQPRVVGRGQHRDDVLDAGLGVVPRQQIEHLLLNINAVHEALGADGSRHASGVVAGSHADVGDDHAGRELHSVQHDVRALFVVALGTLEPVGAPKAHRLRRDALLHSGQGLGGHALLRASLSCAGPGRDQQSTGEDGDRESVSFR